MINIFNEENKISLYNLSENLDDEQVEAVFAKPGNILCQSIAGSGKTRVITYRVAFLLANNLNENNIMLLTFTNKASKEMVDRIKNILQKEKLNILAGTFHHVALIFLRKYAKLLGYENNFTILTPADAKDLISTIRDEKKKIYKFKTSDFPSKKVIYSIYSKAMNLDMNVEDFVAKKLINEYDFTTINIVKSILTEYIQRKKEEGLMDFDDILVNFRELLRNDNVRSKISKQYTHVLVDEYQDINKIQYDIIRLLNKDNNNLFAVGDCNQSIYGWRGARVEYIEKFSMYFPGTNLYSIETNYRSEGHILKLAESSINNNYNYRKVKMKSVKGFLEKPRLVKTFNEDTQAKFICNQIISKKKEMSYKDMAILVRYNFQTPILERCLRKNKIPYKMFAGKSFFDRKHINDVLSYLKLFANSKDETALYRCLKMFDGIGEVTATKIFKYLKDNSFDLKCLEKNIVQKELKLKPKAFSGFSQFSDILLKMKECSSISLKIETLLNSFYLNYLRNSEEDFEDRKLDLDYFRKTSEEYISLDDFLRDMMIEDISDEKESEGEQDAVILTTIHKSKGLEYECVFLPYLNDGIFPKKSESYEDLKEERRIFYVACTRARKQLIMSYVVVNGEATEFLTEVEDDLYKLEHSI